MSGGMSRLLVELHGQGPSKVELVHVPSKNLTTTKINIHLGMNLVNPSPEKHP